LAVTIRCEILLFAELRESLGRSHLSIELAEGATVAEAIERLATQHAAIAQWRGKLAVAVDDAYARPDAILRDGCRIALIPPVSGG
jgi:molybdopterin converting factor subunit 1